VTATATGGTNSYGVSNGFLSSPTIRNSSITGTTNSMRNTPDEGGQPLAQVADILLGGVVDGTGFTCVGVYTTAFVALPPSCV
jgi:hypothetical protein